MLIPYFKQLLDDLKLKIWYKERYVLEVTPKLTQNMLWIVGNEKFSGVILSLM
jgi:hypothetical protein